MKPITPEQLAHGIFGLGCGPYPERPGSKERGGESEKAANAIAPIAADLRGKGARLFFDGYPAGFTADEVASQLRVSPFSMRPRITELYQAGLIRKSDERRRNRSLMTATVWIATEVLVGERTIAATIDEGVNPSLIPGASADGGMA